MQSFLTSSSPLDRFGGDCQLQDPAVVLVVVDAVVAVVVVAVVMVTIASLPAVALLVCNISINTTSRVPQVLPLLKG
jgi:hypothetical protein